ncbi:unnamed protein product [Brassicogethes aeneus]|uniref:N-acetyltransferase domain-containing protein n=1 Tax=Brassicogethes aeneus TaxID=1431903 RepID=A0A9P0BJC1_BRAAE|nr:unnamed protein product [Brassicogethes aeneus]
MFIVIRESRHSDTPAISEVVRNAYTSGVFNAWLNALFHEVTFQSIILVAALLFILFSVPLFYCIVAVPIVLVMIFVCIYGSLLMKVGQLLYEKKVEKCWVAEVYEPFFHTKKPKNCWYKFTTEEMIKTDEIQVNGLNKKIIGTVAVQKHNHLDACGWLFRLAVDERYRRKSVALKLVQTLKTWCHENRYNYIECVMSECQEGARQLFNEAGFDIKQLYHKQLFTNAISLQMFQLRCEVRQTFN